MTDHEPDEGPECGTTPDCDGRCCKRAEPRDVVRAARLDSLSVLLTRIANGRTLTPEEARLLVQHVGTEVAESTTARAAGAETDRLRADIAADREQQWPQRLGQAEKALNRVRRLAEFTRDHVAPARDDMSLAQHELACAVLAALDGPGPAATQATEPNNPAASPSRRAGLHDALVGALGQIPVIPPVAHRRAQADNVLALLYREWPWLRAEAEDAPAEPQPHDWTPPPPGSTREQLPDDVLAAIRPGPYLSTACHAAFLCETSEPTDALAGWPQRLHARCRINNKFTGRRCICGCHAVEEPGPA